jgi:hypothetical protein
VPAPCTPGSELASIHNVEGREKLGRSSPEAFSCTEPHSIDVGSGPIVSVWGLLELGRLLVKSDFVS